MGLFEIIIISITATALCIYAARTGYELYNSDFARLDHTSQQIIELKKELTDDILEVKVDLETNAGKIGRLELDYSELHEFVNRGIKRMATRASRAEELTELYEQSQALDETPNPSPDNIDLFRPSTKIRQNPQKQR